MTRRITGTLVDGEGDGFNGTLRFKATASNSANGLLIDTVNTDPVADGAYDVTLLAGNYIASFIAENGTPTELGRITVTDGDDTTLLALTGAGNASSYTFNIGDLTDVDGSNTTTGYVLTRQSDGSFAMAAQTGGSGGGASALSELSDVTLDTLTDGELLVSSGGDFINRTIAEAGLATSAQGALADTAVQSGDLATVATTGAYSDLTGTPTLGTAAAAATGDFATAAQGAKADTAVQPAALGDYYTSAQADTIFAGYGDVVNSITAGSNITITGGSQGDLTITGGAGGGGGATELNGLSDVTLDTVGDGEVLVYDSATSDFINQTFAEAGISATGHTHTLSDITDAGTMAGETAADYTPTSGLATVATTGAYSDLSGKPTLGTAAATASTDYATSVQGGLADSALQSADIGVSVQAYDAVLDATTASFTTDDESKLDGIAAGAEVNVQSDWDAESGDAFIANKPTLGTAAAAATGDFATAAQGALADSALQSGDVGTMAAETATDYYTKTAADALYDGKQATGDYVTSTDVTAIVELTQAAYDALDPVVATTLYVIVG